MTHKRILLTGFMGAGKSTIGQQLAERLSWRFLDADAIIELDQGMSITDIFNTHGEKYFRHVERSTIANLMTENHLVLALGGGAIETEATRDLLLHQSSGTLLVHLEISLETALARCAGTESTRPVLANSAALNSRYQRRLPLYRKAHHSIQTDAQTVEETLDAILKLLQTA